MSERSKAVHVDDVRLAGDTHAVITTSGGGSRYRRKPCETCPWRKDAVGEFPAEAFVHSANTSYDMTQKNFACHESGSKRPAICTGFLLRNSANNLSVRLLRMRGKVDLAEVSEGGQELFESYRAMAVANGVEPDHPALERSRADFE
jgi:hypothetical protein